MQLPQPPCHTEQLLGGWGQGDLAVLTPEQEIRTHPSPKQIRRISMAMRRKNEQNILKIPLLFLLPGSFPAPFLEQFLAHRMMDTGYASLTGTRGRGGDSQCHHSSHPNTLPALSAQSGPSASTCGGAGIQTQLGPCRTKTQLAPCVTPHLKSSDQLSSPKREQPSITPLLPDSKPACTQWQWDCSETGKSVQPLWWLE